MGDSTLTLQRGRKKKTERLTKEETAQFVDATTRITAKMHRILRDEFAKLKMPLDTIIALNADVIGQLRGLMYAFAHAMGGNNETAGIISTIELAAARETALYHGCDAKITPFGVTFDVAQRKAEPEK